MKRFKNQVCRFIKMALRIFDTNDARYYLGLGNHISSSESLFHDVNFSNLDFIVFEDADGKLENGKPALEEMLLTHTQYKNVYKRISRENPQLPIYGVDVGLGKYQLFFELVETGIAAIGIGLTLKGILEKDPIFLLGGLLIEPMIFDVTNAFIKYDTKLPSLITNISTTLFPLPMVGYRDAVVAKKTREYLVRKDKKDKKPEVALLFGAGHSGIESKLKHPGLCNLPLRLYNGIQSKETLNEVREIVRDENGSLRTIYHNCELF